MSLFLLGSMVNAFAIIIGAGLGTILPRIPDGMRTTITQGLALCVLLIGLGMALQDQKDILYIIISVVLGGLMGEWLQIENRLLRFGDKMEIWTKRISKGPVSEAFVASTLLFCIGSMAIVGALQNGLNDNPQTLLAKSVLDGITAVVFSSTLGIGVAFAALPVFLYEGGIALVAHLVGSHIDNASAMDCLIATGGLLLIAIAANLYGLKKVQVANLLPALLIAPTLEVYWPIMMQWTTHVFH